MRYLLTGHTGFKGSWLTLWLAEKGHEVSGLALDPERDALFTKADITSRMHQDFRGDIRDLSVVQDAVRQANADILIHMAAQPLVRQSYRSPRDTIETNVMGTLNVLEAAANSSSLQAQVIVTTDKVYRNVNQIAGYVETDPLGGDDPYSASKAMADILTQSWARSFPGPRTAVARAGNVIGGGDVCQDRLFPDIVRTLAAGQVPRLRYPNALRPWQHVLDCLNGYMTLVDALILDASPVESGSAWNLGPDEESLVSVSTLTDLAAERWGVPKGWTYADEPKLHEAALLALDAHHAQETLGWRNHLSLDNAVNWTMDWYRAVQQGTDPAAETIKQLTEFALIATRNGPQEL